MKKQILILTIIFCLLSFSGVYAWDSGGWDQSRLPYVIKTTAPTVNDTSFAVPYMWYNSVAKTWYILVDNTIGAAVWNQPAVSGGSPSFDNVDLVSVTDGYMLYIQPDAAGFGDSPLSTDGTDVSSSGKLTFSTTSEPAISITMTGITGTDNQAIDIVGGEALGAEEHWTGIRVKPDDLDPSGVDTRIRGIASNLSGIDVSNIPESMDALRLVMPDGKALTGTARAACNALSIQDGDIDHYLSVPNTAASLFTAYDFVIDAELLHANSCIHTISVSLANGAPSGTVAALSTDTHIDPIHQHIGTYSTPDQATPDAYSGYTDDGGSTWIDGADGNEIFKSNGDIIWIGSAAKFSELEVLMTSDATKLIGLTFEYSTGAATWASFGPNDDTDGFQQSGLISWSADNLTSWSVLGDPGSGDSAAGYWIRITRISGPDPGTPTPTTIQTGTIVLYGLRSLIVIQLMKMIQL